MTVRGGRFWLTPPDLELRVRRLLGDVYYDPCPCPRPDKYNALNEEWIRPWYCNPPFLKIDGGPTDFARKAAAEGGPGVFVCSINAPAAVMLKAGARFVDAYRVRWLEVDSKKPMPSPGMTGIFYLPRQFP